MIMLEKIGSLLYCGWVKSWYDPILCTDSEEVYVTKRKIVVVVKNRELGEKIYDIISFLKESNKVLCINNMFFSISDYVSANLAISCFFISIPEEFDFEEYESLDKLQRIVLLISGLCDHSVFLDESKFEFKDFDSMLEVLSFLTVDSEKGTFEKTIGLLVKYIHYYLSGKNDFEEFYSKLDKDVFFEISDMPYDFSIVKMCYEYYLTGELPDNIYDTISYRDEEQYRNYLAVKNDGWKSCTADEVNDEFVTYGDIKIFNEMTTSFKKFLQYDYDSKSIKDLCLEIGEERVIDLDGQIVGYKTTSDIEQTSLINDSHFDNQKDFFDFFGNLMTFVLKTRKIRSYENDESADLDKCIVCDNNEFKFKTFSQIYQFFGTGAIEIAKQLSCIFFKIYKKMIINMCGGASSQNELLTKPEVRYLSPTLAMEFTKFFFGENVYLIDWAGVFNDLQLFLYHKKSLDYKHNLYYDSRYVYNPFELPFCFDYEIEQKYGKKPKVSMQKRLSDGRNLVLFSSPKSLKKFIKNTEEMLDEIHDEIGDVASDHIKFVNISEVIYSRVIEDGLYQFIGYVTTPVNGEVISKKSFLKLNNKELMLVFGYYFANFSKYTFYHKYVRMDSNFVFYINVLAEDFKLKETKCDTTKEYLKKMVKFFINLGYNPNAFLDLDFDSSRTRNYSKFFIKLANSYDNYCDEHLIYYSGIACPACLKLNYYLPDEVMKNAMLVFEENIAKHYKISSEFNLKHYKPEAVNITEMEERVDRIVRASVEQEYSPYDFMQDCFIPVKKVLNSDKEFVGYIYQTVNFDGEPGNLCIDLKDLELLKNLPRLKALIRLLTQVQILLRNNLTFSQNPFSHVFLNKSHKKQVQILDIEFADGKGTKSDLVNWVCEYVIDVIESDETLQIVDENEDFVVQFVKKIQEISNIKSNSIDSLLRKLEKTAARMTKYCTVHRLYYDKDYIFCPKCLGIADVGSLKIDHVNKDDITSRNEIGKGGEAVVYEYGRGYVAKVFNESGDINYGLKSTVIARIMQRAETLTSTNKNVFVFPERILVDNEENQMIGYAMKKVDGLPLSVLKDKQVINEQGLTRKDVFEILINVGKGIEKLHSNGIFIGDLNGRNILFDSSKIIYFLDFDGMGIDDILPEFCTDGYIDPISKKKKMITMKDDWYSFAVQAFYYLTYTHPFNGIYMENGKALDIPAKMERRISLLGGHGMKVPAIAESWDWMSAELKGAFYDTFEGELRVSIVQYLINQYNEMYDGISELIRVNPKFVGMIDDRFKNENLIYVVNYNVAVYECDKQRYAIVLTQNNRYVIKNAVCLFNDPNSIKKAMITEDEKFAFVILYGKLCVVDLEKDVCIETKSLVDENIVVNGNSVYYVGLHKDEFIITKRTVSDGGEIEKEQFRVNNGMQKIKCFGVAFNSKFVVVQEAQSYFDEIYCNSYKFCNIGCDYTDTRYNVIYDNGTKTWLVINEERRIVIIKSNGKYDEFVLDSDITVTANSVKYVNGNLYIPGEEVLWIVSVKNQFKCKKMECRKIMNSSSMICDINSRGFSVITNGILYDICRE